MDNRTDHSVAVGDSPLGIQSGASTPATTEATGSTLPVAPITVESIETATPIVEPPPFDFAKHERAAVSAYLAVRSFYADLAGVIRASSKSVSGIATSKFSRYYTARRNPTASDVKPQHRRRKILTRQNIPSRSSKLPISLE
jgi:hypothetical protein